MACPHGPLPDQLPPKLSNGGEDVELQGTIRAESKSEPGELLKMTTLMVIAWLYAYFVSQNLILFSKSFRAVGSGGQDLNV